MKKLISLLLVLALALTLFACAKSNSNGAGSGENGGASGENNSENGVDVGPGTQNGGTTPGGTGTPFDYDAANEAALGVQFDTDEGSALFSDTVGALDDEQIIKNIYGIDLTDVESYSVLAPSMNVRSSLVVMLTPKQGREQAVTEMMDTVMENYQKQWDSYLPDQAELVRNRSFEKIGDTLVYVISVNNTGVLDAIRGTYTGS